VRPDPESLLWRACLNGREPAESLSTAARARLVTVLAGKGWTDAEIASWTRQTTYTTARIRKREQIPGVRASVEDGAA
jgi:hypothetical protein